MTVIGACARIDSSDAVGIRERLATLGGVSTFDLDDPGRVGLLIESESLDAAHQTLCEEIKLVAGVMAVWPIYVDTEQDEPPDSTRGSPVDTR